MTADSLIPAKELLVLIFAYIVQYPTWKAAPFVLGITEYGLQRYLLPAIHWLASVVKEIHFEDRLDWYNHVEMFPTLVTGAVDSFPVRYSHPQPPPPTPKL